MAGIAAIHLYLGQVGPEYLSSIQERFELPTDQWSYVRTSRLSQVNETEGDLVLGVLMDEMLMLKYGDDISMGESDIRNCVF